MADEADEERTRLVDVMQEQAEQSAGLDALVAHAPVDLYGLEVHLHGVECVRETHKRSLAQERALLVELTHVAAHKGRYIGEHVVVD